jgi:two-component system, NarL family, invasion response regulator UvrY
MPSEQIRVMVVDDSAEFRSAMEALIDSSYGFEMVAEASGGEQVLDRYQHAHPDVVVMDIRMPGVGGVEATERLRQVHPESRVVLISAAAEDDVPRRAYDCGAAAVVGKLDVVHAEFLALLRRVVTPS